MKKYLGYDQKLNQVTFDAEKFDKDHPNTSYADRAKILLEEEPPLIKNLRDEKKDKGERTTSQDDFDYIPSHVVKQTLRILFPYHSLEIRNSERVLNSMILTVRIDMFESGRYYVDGIGAKYLSEAKITNHAIGYNPTNEAIELGVGIAYNRAIKNAAKQLGRVFGSEMHEEEQEAKKKQSQKIVITKHSELQTLFIELSEGMNEEMRSNLKRIIVRKETTSYDKAIKMLKLYKDKNEKRKKQPKK